MVTGTLIVDGGCTGHLREGCEETVRDSEPLGHVGGRDIVIEKVIIHYRLVDRPPAHDNSRAKLDVVADLTQDAARTPSSCPGIVQPVERTKPDHSMSGGRDDDWAV